MPEVVRDAVDLLHRLAATKKVEVQIELGAYYDREKWIVTFRYQNDDSDTIKVEAKDVDFQAAVETAWKRLERLTTKGIGKDALAPVALPAPEPVPEF